METLATSGMKSINPHVYTSGRWLRGDDTQRRARHVTFDFEALCRRVIELCPGAASVSSCEKKEGGFNRVFVFTTDNGRRLVARLPFPIAGPPKMTTQSEVATIRYVQAKTSIPVPKILDWCDTASTSIGTEYIIMEHVDGVQLQEMWPRMAGDQKIQCIQNIYQAMKDVANMEFPAYGSLYHNDMDLDFTTKILVDQDFCIGPHCGVIYWDSKPTKPRWRQIGRLNQGPWSSFSEYCDGLVDAGIARLHSNIEPQHRPRYHGSPSNHLSLLDSGRAVIQKMSEDARILTAAAPMLFHPDLNKRNIFVMENDPTVITGIIDWQSTSVEPAFWYADDIPDFASSVPDTAGETDRDNELCHKAFSACVQFLIPRLAFPMSLDGSLFRPFRYCYRTWKDGAVAFLHELVQTSQQWTELGFPGSCPFEVPTPEELVVHQQDYRKFVAAQELRRDLSILLNTASDGWVPPEAWEATSLAHKEMFANMLEAIMANEHPEDDEPIRNEQDLREIWPFDLDLIQE